MKWKSVICISNRDLLIHQGNSVLFHFGESEGSTSHFLHLPFTHLSPSLSLLLPQCYPYTLCAAIRIQIDRDYTSLGSQPHLSMNHQSRITAAVLSLWGSISCPLRQNLAVVCKAIFHILKTFVSDKQIETTVTHAAQSLMDDDITSAAIQTCTCECAAIWFHPRWLLGILLAKFVFAF